SVLLLDHFPATLAAFVKQLVGNGRPNIPIPNGLMPNAALKLATEPTPRLLFGLPRNLRPGDFPPPDDAPASPPAVLVLDRHSPRRHDERIVLLAEGRGGKAGVAFHVSLDDRLMRLFAGEWVRNLLRQLGMQEEEALDSGMVSRRLRRAQDKIAATVQQ